MNSTSRRFRLVQYVLCMLLPVLGAGCTFASKSPASLTHFSPCSASGSAFDTLDFAEWSDYYHGSIGSVVDAHMRAVQRTEELKLTCTAQAYEDVMRPSKPLTQAALNIPAWRDSAANGTLSEAHAGPVLLELLRVYECSMRERAHNAALIDPSDTSRTLMQGTQLDNRIKEKQIIDKELSTARPALERTLQVLSGYDRLQPLSVNIECLKRSSLDLRNVLGLAAEASACLPRVLDAHGSLRDPAP